VIQRRLREWLTLPHLRPFVAGRGAEAWRTGADPPVAPMAAPILPESGSPPPVGTDWPPERLAVGDALWGAGFSLPGGEDEVLRLAKPLGLSSASSLVLLGCGAGGAARCLAERLDAWVSGFESDPVLAAAAAQHCAGTGLGRRVQIAVWTPAAPRFPARYYHHALALEPLRSGDASVVLPALAGALRVGGNLVMTEVVASGAMGGDSAPLAAWLRVEHRGVPPKAASLTRVLEGLGFDIRVAEDITDRHLQLTERAWREFVRALAAEPPTLLRAAQVVREAELWLRRAQVMRAGHVRLMRWHAIRQASG
jgi:hypothetical protein